MIRPIEWHENVLKTFTENAARATEEAAHLTKAAARMRAEIKFRQHQIDTAKSRGITAFDIDKFQAKHRHDWEESK